MKNWKPVAVILLFLVIGVAGFNSLILQQEEVLRKYFILDPAEKIKEYNLTLANSLSKYFARENVSATMSDVADYLRKYGRTSLFELTFIFKDADGVTRQATKDGIADVGRDAVASEAIYPVTVDSGRVQGYLLVAIKATRTTELEEGLAKYTIISYSLKFLFFLLTAALVTIVFYHSYSARMKLAKDMAEVRASNDGLTGLYTHNYFMRVLQIETNKARLDHTPLALVMLDVDQFKSFNDKYGHQAGDKVIQEVAKIIRLNTRATDIPARYGGEEFAIAIPYISKLEGVEDQRQRLRIFITTIKTVAERIRKGVEASRIEFMANTLTATISIGVAFCYKHPEKISGEDLLRRADSALYRAKKLGRNRISVDYESVGDPGEEERDGC